MIIPKKIVKMYPNNKPWIDSSLRKLIVESHQMFSRNDPQYESKVTETNSAISQAKLRYKDKVENLLKQNKSKEAWKGLNMITGRDKAKKEPELLRTPGAASSSSGTLELPGCCWYTGYRWFPKDPLPREH